MKRRPILLVLPLAVGVGALAWLLLAGEPTEPDAPAGPGPQRSDARGPGVEPDRPETTSDLPGRSGRGPARAALAAGPGRIAGIVRDERGLPLPGATVQAVGGSAAVQTGPDGLFAIDGLRGGMHALRARASGRVATEAAGIATGTSGLEFVLVPGTRALVRVRRAEDGRPVEVASVEATNGEWTDVATWSADDAAYVLGGAPPGPVHLVVLAPDLVPDHSDRFVPAGGAAEFEVELESGRSLTGRVVDESTGAPVSAAELAIWNEDLGSATARRVRSSDDGAFEAGGFVPGPVGVRVEASGYPVFDSSRAGGSWIVGNTEAVSLEIALPLGLAIDGRVVGPDGAPVDGASVEAREPAGAAVSRGRTAASGRFRLRGVARVRGLYVAASSAAFAPARTPALEWEGADGPAEIRLELGRGVVVAGLVRDPAGVPVAAARATVDLTGTWLGELHPAGLHVETDASGRFRLGPLGPGRYPVLVQHPRFRPRADPLEIPDGARFDEIPLDVVLTPGERLEGAVVDRAGNGIPAATVLAEQLVPGAAESPLAVARTSFDGSFVLESLAPGAITVRALAPGFLPGEVAETRVGGEPIRIELRRRFLVSGVVVAPGIEGADHGHHPGGEDHAEGLGRFTVRLEPTGDPDVPPVSETFHGDEGARFVLDGVADGSYRLEVVAVGYRPWRLEPFLPEEWTGRELSVRLDPGVALTGTVVSAADGQPVAGALVVRGRGLADFDPLSESAHERVLGYTDARGRFRVTGLDPSGAEVSIYHESLAPATLSGRGAGEEAVVRLAPGGRVIGTVLDEAGAPASGVQVVAEGPLLKSAESDPEGRFLLEGLAPGRYRLVRTDRPPTPGTPTVEIAAGETVEISLPVR